MELTLTARRQVTSAQVARYRSGTRAEKGQVLDAVVAVTGWHRDHARKALRRAPLPEQPRPPRAARVPVLRYDEAVIEALRVCWAVLDGPAGNRLVPALPTLVPALRRHGELRLDDRGAALLMGMSAATIDRRLAADRAQAARPMAA